MNYELMKKAYEDFGGVWPYNVPDGMAVRNGEYANVPFGDVFNYREWNWVGTKADFNAYSESLRASNINWDEAPEGAEYYADDLFFKKENAQCLFFWDESSCKWSYYSAFTTDGMTPRPEPTVWQPKVGEECEALYGDEWIVSIYLGIDIYGDYAYQMAEGEYKGEFNTDKNINNFRQIKTEREKEIDSIKSIIDDWQSLGNNGSLLLATKLLDAGYRKAEEE